MQPVSANVKSSSIIFLGQWVIQLTVGFICHIERYILALLSEQCYKFEEIRKPIGGNVTKDEIYKLLSLYKEAMNQEN